MRSSIFKGRVLSFLSFALLIMLMLGCGKVTSEPQQKEVWQQTELSNEQKVNALLDSMSDAEKVGQLIMFGMQGTEINDDVRYILNEYKLGGIILFDRNMESKEQVKALNTSLQKSARQAEKVPLLMAIDQEGGLVSRMKEHLVKVPSAQDLGEGTTEDAAQYALASGKELKELGFNVNFAPVADLGLSDKRSYGNQADIVLPFVQAVGNAYHKAGLIYSLKHFPGIGRTERDLHQEGNQLFVSMDDLWNTDLKPFESMISKVDNNDFMVMVSHATYSQIDEKNPASLSYEIMQSLLRNKLGFKGVIITDDMEMGAVANHYGYGEMSVASFKAGADIILMGQEYDHAIEAYNSILKAVRNGEISKERLNESVKRILLMKLQNKLSWE